MISDCVRLTKRSTCDGEVVFDDERRLCKEFFVSPRSVWATRLLVAS